jgi:hypothetical protein
MPQPNPATQSDDFDLQSWLADISADASLSQEEVQSLGKILGNDKVKPKLRDQFLMRRDYSRKTQEIAEQRRQNERQIEDILSERTELAAWKAKTDGQLNKAYADLDAARMTTAQFRTRINTIAEQNGLDPTELLQGIESATAATTTAARDAAATNSGGNGGGNGAASFDPTKFVSADDYNRSLRQLPLIDAQVNDIFDEHQELTGKPLKMEYTDSSGKRWTGRMALLVKVTEHNNRPGNKAMSVRDMYETDFNIPAVRQEQLREAIRKEERDKLDTEYKTKLSEQMLAGGTPGRTTPLADRPKSVLFDEKRDQRTPAERDTAAASGNNGDNGRSNSEPPPSSAATRDSRWQRAASRYVERRSQGIPLGQEAPAGKTGL